MRIADDAKAIAAARAKLNGETLSGRAFDADGKSLPSVRFSIESMKITYIDTELVKLHGDKF